MARAIDIQPIIEEIQSSLEIPSYSEHDKGFDDGLKYVLDLIENPPTLTPPNEPERAGLYGKYTVYKNKDGSLVTDCFILRPAKDPAAVIALRSYAAATDNAELSADIINWVGAEPNEHLTCDGCISLGTSYGPCMNCIRSRLRGDMYRRPPEGEEDT